MKSGGGKRPVGRPRVGPVIETAIKALRQGGMGMHEIARSLRVGVSVVQRVAIIVAATSYIAHREAKLAGGKGK